MTDSGFSDKLKGAGNKAKGETKEQVGKAVDDKKLQVKGKADKAKGEAQEKIGEVKDVFNKKNNE